MVRCPPRDGAGNRKQEALGTRVGRLGRSGSWAACTTLTCLPGLAPGFSGAAGFPPRASREKRRPRDRGQGGSGLAELLGVLVASQSAACPLLRWRRRWLRCPARSAGRAGGSCSYGACPVRGRPSRGAGRRREGARSRLGWVRGGRGRRGVPRAR